MLTEKVNTWLWSVAAKRVGAAAAGLVVGWLMSIPVQAVLAKSGVTIDPETLRTSITGAVTLGTVAFHDWARLQPWGKKL